MQLPVRAIWVFHTAAQLGSISKAAEELSVTSAVTQIQSLELQLGVSLLAKAGRRIVLTEAGERYFSMITSEIERISDATGTIRRLPVGDNAGDPRDADAFQQMAPAPSKSLSGCRAEPRGAPGWNQRTHGLQS